MKRRNDVVYWGLIALIVLFRIWLILGVPKYYIAEPHDDLFYARAAHFILHGQWMGPYDSFTLIKAPFYAFFLIFSYFTGLPLLVNETLFFVIGCLLLCVAVKPIITNKWWRLGLLFIMIFIPAYTTTLWTLRVYREYVFFSLSIFVLACSLGLYLRINNVHSRLKWAAGLGVSLGALLITREEGVWIYPTIITVLFCCLLRIRKINGKRQWLHLLILLIPIVLSIIPTLIVSYLNFSYYDFWGVSENTDHDLNKVLNIVYSVKGSDWKPYKPVNEDTLESIYRVSPLFVELKPYIGSMEGWINASDVALSAKPSWYREKYVVKGKEIAGGHFSWLFRYALDASGKYKDGTFPREFLVRLGEELKQGCDSGELICAKNNDLPLIGSIQPEQVRLAIRFFIDYFSKLMTYDYQTFSNPISLDLSSWRSYEPEYKYFDEFVYNPIGNEFFGNKSISENLINGSVDLRIKALQVKDKMVKDMFSFHRILLLPIALFLILGNCILLVFSLLTDKKEKLNEIVLIGLFVFEYLVTRLATLAIIDATTSVPAIHYITSSYVYIYVILFIMSYLLIDKISRILKKE